MKILEVKEEMLGEIPRIARIASKVFNENSVVILVVEDDGNINYVVRCGGQCVYIDKDDQYNVFYLDSDGKLIAFLDGEYTFVYEDDEVEFVKGDVSGSLKLVDLGKLIDLRGKDREFFDGYNGFVFFSQRNEKGDLVDIIYQHMYWEVDGKKPIYSFHTKEIDGAFIKRNSTLRNGDYYRKLTYYNGDWGYNVTALEEHGLVDYVKNGAFRLNGSNEVTRYGKYIVVDSNGRYLINTKRLFTEEELKDKITSLGFETEIPEVFLKVYNDEYLPVKKYRELASLMQELRENIEEDENEKKCIILRFTNNN